MAPPTKTRLARMKRRDRQPKANKRSTPNNSSSSEATPPELPLLCKDPVFEEYWAAKAVTAERSDEDIEELQAALQSGCLNARLSTSADMKLAQAFISSLGHLHMQAGFCILVPSYIGQSKAIDLAAQAVIAATEYRKRNDSNVARSAYYQYGDALLALRQTISFSDESLMAVALLSMFEGVMRMHTPAQFSHRYGIARIMLSRKQSSTGPSELERMMLYSDWDRRFRAPVALGMVSPFEDPYWLNAVPRARHTPPMIVKLRMLTNQLYIRLPRLVLYARGLREGRDGSISYLEEEVTQLANDLLQLRDKEAESTLLHGVKVVKTDDQWDIPIIRYSFEYQTLQQMVFATAYWHARIILMQLCLRLQALPVSPRVDLNQSKEELEAEMRRMLTNIFMSYQFANTLSMMGHICIAQPLIAGYGAISCLDRWQSLPISSVQKWIELRLNDSWGKWGRPFSSRSLEEIHQVFTGGPLEGVLPQTYEDEKHLFEKSADLGKS